MAENGNGVKKSTLVSSTIVVSCAALIFWMGWYTHVIWTNTTDVAAVKKEQKEHEIADGVKFSELQGTLREVKVELQYIRQSIAKLTQEKK